MGKYVVHENFNLSHDYTRIHINDCGHAKPPGTKTGNTEWYGLFVSYLEAYAFADRLPRKNGPYDCKICKLRGAWRAEET